MSQSFEDQTVRCPRCQALEGQPCLSTVTGEPLHAVHWQRLKVTA